MTIKEILTAIAIFLLLIEAVALPVQLSNLLHF